MERMLAGLSTRRYPLGLEPVDARTAQSATATSNPAVSRRFVCLTRRPRLLRGAPQPRNRSLQRYAADGDLDIRLID